MKPPHSTLYTKREACKLEQICGQANRPAHSGLLSCRLAKTSPPRYICSGGHDVRCDTATIRRADGSGDRVPVHHQVKERGARNGHEQTTTEMSMDHCRVAHTDTTQYCHDRMPEPGTFGNVQYPLFHFKRPPAGTCKAVSLLRHEK